MTKTIKEENQYKKGLWTVEEDKILMDYVKLHGKGQWNRISKKTGLKRCGKSCRLRWMNYLSPSVKRGNFSEEEEDLIIRLHNLLGNRWSLIAKRVPGRTDNQVKNYWNTHLSKKLANKEQNSRVGDTISSTSSRADKVFKIPTSSDSSPSCDTTSAVTERKDDRGTEKGLEVSEKLESVIDEEGYLNSFWVSDNDLEMSTFSMIDFLNDYSFYLA